MSLYFRCPMSVVFNAQQRFRRLCTVIGMLWIMAVGCFLTACSSLPEGAAIPQLQIQKVSFDNQDKSNPHFVIEYTLNHTSAAALPLLQLKASIFIKDSQAAFFSQTFQNVQIAPNDSSVQRLDVPANRMSKTAIDSLSNSKLIILEGSCALQAIFSKNPEEQAYNPSDSYVGLLHYIKSNEGSAIEVFSAREDLNPQASTKPLPRPEKPSTITPTTTTTTTLTGPNTNQTTTTATSNDTTPSVSPNTATAPAQAALLSPKVTPTTEPASAPAPTVPAQGQILAPAQSVGLTQNQATVQIAAPAPAAQASSAAPAANSTPAANAIPASTSSGVLSGASMHGDYMGNTISQPSNGTVTTPIQGN